MTNSDCPTPATFSVLTLFLALVAGAPKESGNWIDDVFDTCVQWLLAGAAMLGISYNAINVLVFCVLWPIFTLWLIWLVIHQRAKIRRLAARLPHA